MSAPPVDGRLRAALRAMRDALEGELSRSIEDRVCYSFDATDIRGLPDAVAWPSTRDQVAEVVRIAASAGLPVVARGAGTGYTGGSVPVDGGIVLSMERMNRVRCVDAARRLAVVEPGVVNDDLRAEVESLGLAYPPDPASLLVSTIGGNVAEGAGGPRTVLYGTTRDYVVGLEAVLADGSIVSTGLLADARSAWDAGPLLVGSEGTLAVVTLVALRLVDITETRETYWVEFPSLDAAAETVADITAAGYPVSVLEILDAETLRCSMEYVRGTRQASVAGGSLLIELEGKASELGGSSDSIRALAESRGATVFREARGEEERDELWEMRRAISPSLARISTGKINEDITVPRSSIPRLVRATHEIGADLGLRIFSFGHAGDGNLHVNIMIDRSDRHQMEAARSAVGRLFAAAIEMGGTLSGEHGIGLTKAEHLAAELEPAALALTGAVKRALDPDALLNPDKILTDRPNPWWSGLDDPGAASGGARC